MDLFETWKKLDAGKLGVPVAGQVHIPRQSKHPVNKLKRAYLFSLACAVLFLVTFLVLVFVFRQPIVKISLLAVVGGYVFFLATNWSMYRKIKVNLPVDQHLIVALKHTHRFITDNIRFQERAALFIYPFAAAAGFFIGLSFESDVEEMLRKKAILIILLITIAILTPACYYFAKWLYKISYGRYLTELQDMIDQLEKPD